MKKSEFIRQVLYNHCTISNQLGKCDWNMSFVGGNFEIKADGVGISKSNNASLLDAMAELKSMIEQNPEPLHVAFGVTRTSYTKEQFEKIARVLRECDFRFSYAYQECFGYGRSITDDNVVEEIELMEKILPLARCFPPEKIWDAIALNNSGTKLFEVESLVP